MDVRNKDGLPPLWTALAKGNETLASILVQHGCDRDAWGPGPEESRQTLLHRAIDENNEPAATFLVRSICDLNAVRKPGPNGEGADEAAEKATPLHMAAAWGLQDVASTLVDFGADVNAPDSDGRSPVHVAVYNHQEAILRRLLQTPNVSLSLRDRRSLTPFATAMSAKNNKAAHAILERQPTVAHQVDGKGYNFLHTAVKNGDLEAVLFLIGAQMDVNILTADSDALSPIHLAAAAGHEMILRNLLLAGVQLDARTNSGLTALHLAAEHDHSQLVSILLSHGLSPNLLDSGDNNPLHVAVQRASLATVRVLLSESDVVAEAVNAKGQTVLHILGSQGGENAPSILEAVLKARPKFPVDALDASGNSLILLAYMRGAASLCAAAVEAGVCLGTANADGVSLFTHETPTKQLLFRLLDQLGREPRWSDGDVCSDCGVRFSLTTRKHHCRHCGRLLCAKCSEATTPILKYDLQKPARVCDVCYDVLTLGAAS